MTQLTVTEVQHFAGCNNYTAIEILYCRILTEGKLYTCRGNYANYTINWLSRRGVNNFVHGNDAPRGGKWGQYVTFEISDELKGIHTKLAAINTVAEQRHKAEAERKAQLERDIQGSITPEEKEKYLAAVHGLSRKQERKVAHNFAARKIGHYSTAGMKAFFNLD